MNRFEADDAFSQVTRKSLEGVLGVWETFSGASLTYRARPRLSRDAPVESDRCPELPPFALVVQGPVVTANQFTLESMKLYRRTFPDATLILSTWIDERVEILEAFSRLGVEVVRCERPDHPGQQNINLQLASSIAGVKRAAELGAKYVAKSRTDQRMYARNIQPALMNLLRAFPLKNGLRQRERIVGASLGSFLYRMYGLTDMLVFGHVEDMLLYWSAPQSPVLAPRRVGPSTLRELTTDRVCEVFLATEFLMAIGRKLEWTLADSWRAFADHFCIIDADSLDLYWPKYARFRERRYGLYSTLRADESLNFAHWLQCFTGAAFDRDVPEWVLDVPGADLKRGDAAKTASTIEGA